MKSRRVGLIFVCLGFLSVNPVKSLYFDDSSDSSESSNSTESDEWTGPLLSILGPFLGGNVKTTTTSRPGIKPTPTSTSAPMNSTVSSTTSTTTPKPMATIKCSTKPSEPCPSNCMTDSAVIHGFCCNCKHPLDIKVKPGYLCPASTVCPANTTKLCDIFSRLMVCCCQDDFIPKPSTLPPLVKPIPPPQIGPQTPQLPPYGPTPLPDSGPPSTTPPSYTNPPATIPPVGEQTPPTTPPINGPQPPPSGGSQPTPTESPPPVAMPPSAPSPPDSTSPLPPPRPPPNPSPPPVEEKPSTDKEKPADGKLPSSDEKAPPTIGQSPPKDEKLPIIISPSEKSSNHDIIVEIDSASVQDEIVELPLTIRRRLRKT